MAKKASQAKPQPRPELKPKEPENKPKIRLLLVDDHPIVRERLAELIAQESDLSVCGEAEDANEAIKAARELRPDLAIVDITLKDTYGIELIKHLKEILPKLPVLVLSMHDESLYGERALRAGAKGYLTKQEATKNVIPAIRRILAGEIFVSEKMAATILQRVAGGKPAGGESPTDVLSDRELEVFQLLGQGLPVRQIAENLFVSVKTVEAHREHIKQKMNFKSSAELLRYAIQFTMKQS
jgi:DNA-binding NarL/FixJ family response regulator